jgi:hypothetical protein
MYAEEMQWALRITLGGLSAHVRVRAAPDEAIAIAELGQARWQPSGYATLAGIRNSRIDGQPCGIPLEQMIANSLLNEAIIVGVPLLMVVSQFIGVLTREREPTIYWT